MLKPTLGMALLVAYVAAGGWYLVPWDGVEFPYVVVGDVLEPAPVVRLSILEEVYVAEVGKTAVAPVPYGVFLAIPAEAVNNHRLTHPKAVDVKIREGTIRLVLVNKTEELGPAAAKPREREAKPAAYRVEVFLTGERRGGRIYVGDTPLEIREAQWPTRPPRHTPTADSHTPPPKPAASEPLGWERGSSGLTPVYWGRYFFAPVSYANVVDSPYFAGYAAARFYVATGFDSSSRRFIFDGNRSRTSWAYLGWGVERVYVQVWWRGGGPSSDVVRLWLAYSGAPSVEPPQSRQWLSATTYRQLPGARRLYIFDVSQYSNYYLHAYVDIRNDYRNPLNITIAAQYRRPAYVAYSDNSVYGLLPAEWEWSLLQPARDKHVFVFSYTTYPRGVESILVFARIPSGFNDKALLQAYFDVYTCSGATSQTVEIYMGDSLIATATANNYGAGQCKTFTFSINREIDLSALTTIYSLNATTLIPLHLVFKPRLSPANSLTSVTLYQFRIRGYRWPEIWRHDSETWISAKPLLNTDIPRKRHVREVYMYSVWLGNAESNETNGVRYAYVDIRHQAEIGIAPNYYTGSTVRSIVDYNYVPFDTWEIKLRLRKACLGVESRTSGEPVVNIVPNYVYNQFLESLVATTSAFVYLVSTVITFASLFSGWYGFSIAGAVLWGLDTLLSGLTVQSNYSCPLTYSYASSGYDVGSYGYIINAHWRVAVAFPQLPNNPIMAATYRDFYHHATFDATDVSTPSKSIRTLSFLAVRYDLVNKTFGGPAEPFALGWSGFFVRFG